MLTYKSVLLIKIVDSLSIVGSGILAYFVYFGFSGWPIAEYYNIAFVISTLLSLVIFPWFNLDSPSLAAGTKPMGFPKGRSVALPFGRRRGSYPVDDLNLIIFRWKTGLLFFIFKFIAAWVSVIIIMVLFGLLFTPSANFSRDWLLLWTLFGAFILIFMRLAVYYSTKIFAKREQYTKKIVVIGTQKPSLKLFLNIRDSGVYTNLEIIAFFDTESKLQDELLENTPINHNISALPDFVKNHEIGEVWVTPSSVETSHLEKVLNQLRDQLVTVRFVTNLFPFRLIHPSAKIEYGLPVITLTESPMVLATNRLLKEIEDKAIASLILLLISPLITAIALGIKLTSPGPVFFRQERVGWSGREFMMFKFRSMPVNAEQESGPVWNNPDDNRATVFGAYLRKTSLDELPQLWNVLKGEMSIVGPRPERPYFVEQFKQQIPDYMQKHLVKPGITGWAQINGWRGNTDLRQRIEHDIFYIQNWSVWFDLKIIFMTVFRIFFDRNAY